MEALIWLATTVGMILVLFLAIRSIIWSPARRALSDIEKAGRKSKTEAEKQGRLELAQQAPVNYKPWILLAGAAIGLGVITWMSGGMNKVDLPRSIGVTTK